MRILKLILIVLGAIAALQILFLVSAFIIDVVYGLIGMLFNGYARLVAEHKSKEKAKDIAHQLHVVR